MIYCLKRQNFYSRNKQAVKRHIHYILVVSAILMLLAAHVPAEEKAREDSTRKIDIKISGARPYLNNEVANKFMREHPSVNIRDWVKLQIQGGLGTQSITLMALAGKTGTSQNEGELPHAWFIGYLPADNPEIAIVAMIENVGEGSTFAAPLFRQVAEAYYDIAPEGEAEETPEATATPASE